MSLEEPQKEKSQRTYMFPRSEHKIRAFQGKHCVTTKDLQVEREEKGKSSTFRELVSRLIRPITNSMRRKREIVK